MSEQDIGRIVGKAFVIFLIGVTFIQIVNLAQHLIKEEESTEDKSGQGDA